MAIGDTGSRSQEPGTDKSRDAEQTKLDASRLTQSARARTLSYIEERKKSMADNIVGMADAVRGAAQQLDEHGNAAMADYVQRAADGLERFSDTVRTRDISSLMDDVEDFARRRPAIVIGASVAVGFLLARFLKSSSERREAEHHGLDASYDSARGNALKSQSQRSATSSSTIGGTEA